MADLAHVRELLELDWLECRGKSGRYASRLHFVEPGDVDRWVAKYDEEERLPVFRTACERLLTDGRVAPLGARLGTPRCAGCCAALGYPRGVGAPKNDPAVRPLVLARLAAVMA